MKYDGCIKSIIHILDHEEFEILEFEQCQFGYFHECFLNKSDVEDMFQDAIYEEIEKTENLNMAKAEYNIFCFYNYITDKTETMDGFDCNEWLNIEEISIEKVEVY